VLHVAGAGSLASAFTDLLRRFPACPDTVAAPEFGPSGLMREKIEAGANIDLFASADMLQARRLAVGHPERFAINFTRNRLCAIARGALGLTSANMLDRLLDPMVRLATSTPGADPAGDCAWVVFARAETVRPGARAALEAKAQQLYGGGAKTPPLVPGKGAVEGIFLANRAGRCARLLQWRRWRRSRDFGVALSFGTSLLIPARSIPRNRLSRFTSPFASPARTDTWPSSPSPKSHGSLQAGRFRLLTARTAPHCHSGHCV